MKKHKWFLKTTPGIDEIAASIERGVWTFEPRSGDYTILEKGENSPRIHFYRDGVKINGWYLSRWIDRLVLRRAFLRHMRNTQTKPSFWDAKEIGQCLRAITP